MNLIWTCWIVGLAAMTRLILRKLDGLTTAALVMAFAVCPATLMASANCYVESFLLMNVAVVLIALGVKYRPSRVSLSLGAPEFLRASPLLLGILAGGSAAVKLTGLSVLLLPLLWYAGGWLKKRVRTRRTLLGVAQTSSPPPKLVWTVSEPACLIPPRLSPMIWGGICGQSCAFDSVCLAPATAIDRVGRVGCCGRAAVRGFAAARLSRREVIARRTGTA